MTASIEDRIVAMKMENTQFEKAAAQSLATFAKLEASLNKGVSAKGLDNISNNMRGFNLNPMENALSGISKSWLAMSTIALTALSQITSSVISTGTNMVKSLSLDQITGGFNEYSTNLNAIQTTLANTQAQGTTLDDVNAALQQLNHYSDKTIYNFGEMAKNIGTFTAAGVNLEGSVSSIKGIANLAALSGSSSEQASTAMYQLSQAIAAGRVSLQDWNSVVNAGMGGSTFQKALAQTATTMGTIDSSAIKIEKSTGKMTINGQSFRDSISAVGGEKWLTSDVLTKTLDQFTGDMTDAQLAAEGFNKEQIAAIQQTAKTASDAATKVKTIKQVFDVARETVGSGWSKTFQTIFGDFETARTTMTNLSNFVGKIIKKQAKDRNQVLASWAHFGGRTAAIDAIKNAWEAVMSVVTPIKEAFREIFPATTGFQLAQMTKSVRDFFDSLKVGKTTGENIKRTFAGLFAVIHIGWQIVSALAGAIFGLFGSMSGGASSLLGFTGSIGDLLVKFDKWLETSGTLTSFFDGLASVLSVPIKLIGDLAAAFGSLFGGADSGGLNATGEALGRVTDRLSPLQALLDVVSGAWQRFTDIISAGVKLFGPVVQGIADIFGGLGTAIANSMSTGDFSPVLDIINTGLFGAITLLFAKFVKSGINFNLFGGDSGMLGSIAGSLDALTGSLQAMQANIQAGTLLKIGGAIALITASVVALSLIDSAALTKALAALSVGFAQLLGAMAILTKISGSAGFVKIPLIAGSMVLLAGSVLILSGAVAILASMSWEQLSKGLLGVGVLLGFIAGFATLMQNASGPILRVGLAMVPLAVGLNLMAGAMKIFATMSWGEMAKGLVGVAGGLLIIAGAMSLMPVSMPLTAAGLLLVGIALNTIATSMLIFATMSWEDMAKGMVGIAGGLLLIAGAMQLMPLSLPVTAAGLVLVAVALNGIALAAKAFATMSWEELGKAAAALAGALLIIAGGLYLMTGTLAGSAALLVAAGALAILGPVLVMLGAMSWEMIGKGLATLAGIFVILGVAGLVLAPIVPVIFALAAAILLLGAGMALAGAGMLAFGIGLAALAGAGGAGIAVLKQGIIEMITLLPELAVALVEVLFEMMNAIAKHEPEMVAAFVTVVGALLEGATKLLPKFGQFISKLIETGLKVLVSYYSDLANAGLNLILNLLRAFESHVGDIADSATNLAINFVKAMGRNAVKFANAAADAIVDFLNGLADAITAHSAEINAAGTRVGIAIIAGVTQPLRAAGQEILNAIQAAWNWAKDNFHPSISIGGHHILGRGNVDVVGQMVEKLGLVGGVDDVKNAFSAINDQLDSEISKAKDSIQKAQDKLKKLKKEGKGDSKEANKLRDQISDQTKALKELNQEEKNWSNKQKQHRKDLLDDARTWDYNAEKIKYWTDEVTKAENARDSFQAGVISTFGGKPDITKGQSLGSYMREIAKKTQDTQKFMATLQALRNQNLSDESYRQLLAEGTDAQKLMEQLLTGGGEAITAFNQANSNLTSAAATLASTASVSLFYDAAVAEAQGHLKGWQDSQAALEEQMNVIARAMVKALNKALKIKSPSRVFAESGKYSTEGVAMGMEAGIGALEKSAEKVALASLEALQNTMNKASSILDLDLNPTITPVLDLAQLQKDASKIGTMWSTDPTVGSFSYRQAQAIAESARVASESQGATAAQPPVQDVKIEQNNYSPKALDPIAVYRANKSAIALAKEALNS